MSVAAASVRGAFVSAKALRLDTLQFLADGDLDDPRQIPVGHRGAHERLQALELPAQLDAGGKANLVARGGEGLHESGSGRRGHSALEVESVGLDRERSEARLAAPATRRRVSTRGAPSCSGLPHPDAGRSGNLRTAAVTSGLGASDSATSSRISRWDIQQARVSTACAFSGVRCGASRAIPRQVQPAVAQHLEQDRVLAGARATVMRR